MAVDKKMTPVEVAAELDKAISAINDFLDTPSLIQLKLREAVERLRDAAELAKSMVEELSLR